MIKQVTSGVVLLALSSLAVGCGGSNPGQAGPTGTDSQQSGGNTLPHDGAPKVGTPVDVTAFKAAPCSVLTAQQVKTLGLPTKTRPNPQGGVGPTCEWTGGGAGSVSLTVAFLKNPDGLSDLYELNRQPGKYAKFEPVSDVNGFPAVSIETDEGDAKSGRCGYSVGLTDNNAMSIVLGEPAGGDPCDDARQVALSATKTIKQGGSGG